MVKKIFKCGHPYTKENISPVRRCKTCTRIRTKKYKRKHRYKIQRKYIDSTAFERSKKVYDKTGVWVISRGSFAAK